MKVKSDWVVVMPSSSWSSRRAAWMEVSPASTWPEQDISQRLGWESLIAERFWMRIWFLSLIRQISIAKWRSPSRWISRRVLDWPVGWPAVLRTSINSMDRF